MGKCSSGRLAYYIPSMSTLTRGAAPLIGALALASAIQVPAHAETYTHVDARHDVEKSPQRARAPHYRQTDVTRVRINHGVQAIRFTIRLRSSSLKNLEVPQRRLRSEDPGPHVRRWLARIARRGSVLPA